jgi:hypothetical protein
MKDVTHSTTNQIMKRDRKTNERPHRWLGSKIGFQAKIRDEPRIEGSFPPATDFPKDRGFAHFGSIER